MLSLEEGVYLPIASSLLLSMLSLDGDITKQAQYGREEVLTEHAQSERCDIVY